MEPVGAGWRRLGKGHEWSCGARDRKDLELGYLTCLNQARGQEKATGGGWMEMATGRQAGLDGQKAIGSGWVIAREIYF